MIFILVALILVYIVLIIIDYIANRAVGNQKVAAALRDALPPELELSGFKYPQRPGPELGGWYSWTGWVIYVKRSRFLGPFSLIAADIATDPSGTRWFIHVKPKWRSTITQVVKTVRNRCPYVVVKDIDSR